MKQLDDEGFDFNNGYMFGFSFGAWLAIKTAKTFGEKRFAQIDGIPWTLSYFSFFYAFFTSSLQSVIQVKYACGIGCNVWAAHFATEEEWKT